MAENPKEEMESKIREAMLSCVNDFKSQADSLTMEGVRRALEKELGMERLSLDAYKKFIKQCVEKYFNDDGNENASEAEAKIEEPFHSAVVKESGNKKGDLTNSSSDINKNSEESEMSHESPGHNKEINEDIIKKAIRTRAAYFRGNLEITLIKVRRLLEEDLKLEKGSLDAHKKLISTELDKTLQSSDIVDDTNSTKKKQTKTSNKKVSKKVNEDSDSSNSDEKQGKDEDDEAVKRTKKRPAQKIKNDTKVSKKQKVIVEKKKTPLKKRPAEEDSDKIDESDHKKPKVVAKKQNEKPTPVYGKKVERLRSIIKSCGLGIPPAVYRRAKQAPENKREAGLIKELADILQKEGLSTDPSEKEIQEVKKRKQRAKDLEGIDMSNIVSSSRRRSSSYIPIPPPKIEDSESDEEGEEEEEEEDDEENEEDSEVRVSDAEDSEGGASDAEDSNAGSGDEAEDESD